MPGPKSILSLIAGLRASGYGSAATMVPTRMSTRSKSANEISGRRPFSSRALISAAALRLEHHVGQRLARIGARPDDELEGRIVALARLQRRGQQHLDLLAGRLGAAGEQQRLPEHDRALLLPQV